MTPRPIPKYLGGPRVHGLVAQVMLADPGQAIAPHALSLVAHEWLERTHQRRATHHRGTRPPRHE